jgi:hypothetical protein
VPLLTSEISPIQAYSEIKANRARLKRQHGRTIVLPIVFKVIPRGLFPNKPINTGAYFMSVVRPAEFAAGFALPPTLFGDAYVNFGMGGAVLACLLVGPVAAALVPHRLRQLLRPRPQPALRDPGWHPVDGGGVGRAQPGARHPHPEGLAGAGRSAASGPPASGPVASGPAGHVAGTALTA